MWGEVVLADREHLQPAARRYLKVTDANAEIDTMRAKSDARFDGKWVLRATTDLPPEQVALAYRGLWRGDRSPFDVPGSDLVRRCVFGAYGGSPAVGQRPVLPA